MIPILMQDRLSINGVASGNPIAQDPKDWVYTAPYQDMTFLIDVREVSPVATGPTFVIETAPIRDETLFQTGVVQSFSAPAGSLVVGLNAAKSYLISGPAFPIAYWTRWRLLAGTAAWNITFRVWANGNTKHSIREIRAAADFRGTRPLASAA